MPNFRHLKEGMQGFGLEKSFDAAGRREGIPYVVGEGGWPYVPIALDSPSLIPVVLTTLLVTFCT